MVTKVIVVRKTVVLQGTVGSNPTFSAIHPFVFYHIGQNL
jgi:hypothetical protein